MLQAPASKLNKQIYALLSNRWALGCFSILAFQQMIEASATYWLVCLMESITKGEAFLPYLALYLASVAIPYIPGCFGFILKITWKQEAQRVFINNFVKTNKNNISEWSNKGLREQKVSMLTSEGPAAIHAFIDYLWELLGYIFNVFFSILALSIIVEPLFAAAYAFSVCCVIYVMKVKRRTQRQLTQKALTARVSLVQSLLAAWDNILLGNEYNFSLWEEKTNKRLDSCIQKNVALERFDQILAIAVSCITSIPMLIVVVYYAIAHQHDPVKLSAFVVILPILFIIISYTYQTLSLGFRWNMHMSKLLAIFRSIQASKDSPVTMEKKVKWPKISISSSTPGPTDKVSLPLQHPLQSYHELLMQTSNSGRLTIRGDNGCGKSTALMLIKKALENRAFFLPTHNQLIFTTETNKNSTGESLKNRLMEILERVDADVLLLDEWDANLDKENQETLSALIDELSEKKCVIEVRHR